MEHKALLRKIYWISAILIVVILVVFTSVVFLNPSSVGNPRFVWNINLWALFWAANFVIVLVLSFVLARNLIKLFFEYQDNRPGSGIKTKLVITLILFSLFPALVMAFLAFGLINQNLRQWFSSPSEQLLNSSTVIARRYYQQDRKFRLMVARFLSSQAYPPEDAAKRVAALAKEYDFEGLLLFDRHGRVVSQSGNWRDVRFLDPRTVLGVLEGESYSTVERRINIDHGIVGVPVYTASRAIAGALFARYAVPESVAFHAIQVGDASRKYAAIKEGVDQLELNYFSILGLTTLAVVFGFVWLGTYIAKKITVPLEALAEGSRELAEGNLDHRVGVTAVDELGILVDSFNRMAEEVKQSREKLEKANAQLRKTNERLDERRRYIETILQNVATGVMSIDEADVIRAVNEAALNMLQVHRENILNRSIREVADPELYEEFLAMKKRARLHGTYRKEVTFKRGERHLHVAATITSNPLPFQTKAEYLIVLDDLTELIRAEKFAAWQEVARRLAHEIKNPLTPIQLSAQRVQRRFEQVAGSPDQQGISEFQEVLAEAMRIIVHEAEVLRSLVEEFSKFARLPICKPQEVHLHDLIEATLALYDGGFGEVELRKVFDARIETIRIDPEQMKRVFINVIDNSLDALAESGAEPCILIRTQLNAGKESVTIEVQDNGVGIEPQDYDHLFLPYFSTKKKGTGLGLAIVRQIVSEHTGFVRAETNHPQGTRFIMELPIAGPPTADYQATDRQEPQPAGN